MFDFGPDMIFRIPALIIALTIHEYAHARAAVTMGDLTPKYLGRDTLNPIPHLDPLGLILLFLTQFGWAKPVPINPNNFRDGRKGVMWVSLAGPLSNIFVAILAAIFITLLPKLGLMTGATYTILRFIYIYNIIFAVFNLIPLPPLDGSKVLMSLLPGPQAYSLQKIEPYGPMILIVLVVTGIVENFTHPLYYGLSVIIQTVVRAIF